MPSVQLETDRLILRPPRRTDALQIAKYANHPSVGRNTFMPYPYNLEDAFAWIERTKVFTRQDSVYALSIYLKDAGHLIGGIGIEEISKNHRCAEIGYWLGKPFRRKGIMREAIVEVLRFCYSELNVNRVQANIFVTNTASYKLLESLGFVHEGTIRQRFKKGRRHKDAYLYSLLKSEWRQRAKRKRA